jgi:purine-nucleoside phosphorylase
MNPEIQNSMEYLQGQGDFKPRLAIILGSGLGSFADMLDSKLKIAAENIPHYPVSTVEGHQGFLVFGSWKNIPLLAVQGRTHYYEGYSIEKITYIVRIIAALGIKTLIVTNAGGAVNPKFIPGDLMLITDHINNMFRNPLHGPLKYGGARFPDMSEPYAAKYFDIIESVAKENEIILKRGVLCVSTGPTYETAAEIKMIATAGGDAASMSTVPEVIVARQAGIEVIGISCITNLATGISDTPLSHQEVTKTANLVQKKFLKLISGIILKIGES